MSDCHNGIRGLEVTIVSALRPNREIPEWGNHRDLHLGKNQIILSPAIILHRIPGGSLHSRKREDGGQRSHSPDMQAR